VNDIKAREAKPRENAPCPTKLTAAIFVTTAAFFAAFGASAETLRLATVVSAPHPWIDAAEMFKEEVEENTDLTVEIFPGGQLGNDATIVDEMRIGTVDLMIGGVQNIAPFVPSFEFFSLNYLFATWMDQFRPPTEPDSEIFAFFEERWRTPMSACASRLTGGGTRNLSTEFTARSRIPRTSTACACASPARGLTPRPGARWGA
jgi:TRAP-type transport system periplasmic protein